MPESAFREKKNAYCLRTCPQTGQGGDKGGQGGGVNPLSAIKLFFIKGEKYEEGFQVIFNYFSKSYVLKHSESNDEYIEFFV